MHVLDFEKIVCHLLTVINLPINTVLTDHILANVCRAAECRSMQYSYNIVFFCVTLEKVKYLFLFPAC